MLIRAPFGGSNREHHLRMAGVSAVFSALTVFYFIGPRLGLAPLESLLLGLWAFICAYTQELWATADRDDEPKRRPANLYWLPYGRLIKHRSRLSHGLIIGTIARLGWGFCGAPFIMIGAGVYYSLGLATLLGATWLYAALVNDLGHLILDV